jgi:DNA-binding CsgD family transcriptional regulator
VKATRLYQDARFVLFLWKSRMDGGRSVPVELAAITAAAPCQAVARLPSAPIGFGRRGEEAPERDWLDLLAEVAARTPVLLPYERIALLLCRTFRATACSYAGVVENVVVGGAVSWNGELTTLRAAATNDVGAAALMVWDELRVGWCCNRLSLPAAAGHSEASAFVVGRAAPYSSTDRRLATTLWTLLAALDARNPVVAPSEPTSLTPRELAVLGLLDEGLSAVAIAHRLRISVRTVHKHLEHIYAKLEVGDRLMAVSAARRLGVVPLSAGRS